MAVFLPAEKCNLVGTVFEFKFVCFLITWDKNWTKIRDANCIVIYVFPYSGVNNHYILPLHIAIQWYIYILPIVGRGFLTSFLLWGFLFIRYRTILKTPYTASPKPPPPTHAHTQTSFFALFPKLIVWLHHIQCVNLLDNISFVIKDLQLLSLCPLIPKVPCCVVYTLMF